MSKENPINLQGLWTEANLPVDLQISNLERKLLQIINSLMWGEKAFQRRSRNSRWNVDPQR